MLNKEIITASIPSLHLHDTVSQVLELMADFHVTHLPVVIDDKFSGLVSEDNLLNIQDDHTLLSQLQGSFGQTVAHAESYCFEAIQLASEYHLTLVPVIAKDSEYIGSITAMDLLKYLGKITGVKEAGGVLVLEMEKVSFSFSEISKLVETNDAQITQLNTYQDLQSGNFYIVLRINKMEISDIVSTFQRYDYQVKYYIGEELYENELRSNYDHLMNYLNI